MSVQQAKVIIVGGGPVGMGLAIDLAQRGISSIVTERHAQPQPIPKGQNLTQRTMEHFWFWGIEEDVRAASPIPLEFGIGGATAYGSLLSDYNYDWYQRALVRPFYFRDNERLPQYATEAALRRRAAQLPLIETLYGYSAQEFSQDETGVSVKAVERASGAALTLRGDYVVGCDGARSMVRETAGITQTRSDQDMLMALLVFRSDELNTLLARYKGKSFLNVLHPDLKGYWQFFGRVDTGSTWFFHSPVPAGTNAENFDFHKYLEGIVGAPFDCEFQHIGFWDLRIACADTYRAQRAFIAGDAAHSHPPYGGFGINTGFEDARNLGWKLAATLQGWGGPRLLDSYSQERQPVFVSTARDFIANYIEDDRAFLNKYNPQIDKPAFERAWEERSKGASAQINTFEPHYECSHIVDGPEGGACSARGDHSFEARAGHHLAPRALSCGANVYERLGDGFTLLALGADAQCVEAFVAAAQSLGAPLKIVTDTRAGECADYGHSLVLVRPDQFVAFAGEPARANADAIMAQAVGL